MLSKCPFLLSMNVSLLMKDKGVLIVAHLIIVEIYLLRILTNERTFHVNLISKIRLSMIAIRSQESLYGFFIYRNRIYLLIIKSRDRDDIRPFAHIRNFFTVILLSNCSSNPNSIIGPRIQICYNASMGSSLINLPELFYSSYFYSNTIF